MNTIRIKLEYGCFPVWIYGANNELIDNDLPPNLIGDSDIDPVFVHIQEVYDSLYLDNGKEFRYIGFKDNEMRESFFKELSKATDVLKSRLKGEYTIEGNLDLLRELII